MEAMNESSPASIYKKVVVLISCVSKKLDTDNGSVAAKDLYQSPLFKKSLEYATKVLRIPDTDIFILSAEHYLLPLNQRVVKYDKTLNKFTAAQRKAWADKVWGQLSNRFDDNTPYIILAGKNYYKYLIGIDRIKDFELPLGNRGIGQRLSILNSAISNNIIIK